MWSWKELNMQQREFREQDSRRHGHNTNVISLLSKFVTFMEQSRERETKQRGKAME